MKKLLLLTALVAGGAYASEDSVFHWNSVLDNGDVIYSSYKDTKLLITCMLGLKGPEVGKIYCRQRDQDFLINRTIDDSHYYELAAKFAQQQHMREEALKADARKINRTKKTRYCTSGTE